MGQEQTAWSDVKLTALSSKGGCGCKIGPADLSQVIRSLPPAEPNPNLLVGLETGDDAGVYKLTDDLAIVQTVDFFTPIVNDPYAFGQIAAANAISDIYAMGGKPLTALNIVAFPIHTLDKNILAQIMLGAADKAKEAGVTIAGGHSIDDKEPKFGMAVTGTIHPDKIRTNSGAKQGDKLILTKPIGVGIMTTSLKNGKLSDAEIDRVTAVMSMLNKTAAELMDSYEVHACTDVTGFGLLGHTLEMAKGSDMQIIINNSQVPVLERAYELAVEGFVPGGTKNNFNHVESHVAFPSEMEQLDKWILCDAVTSGGLLIALAPEEAEELLGKLQAAGLEAAMIGEVAKKEFADGHVTVK